MRPDLAAPIPRSAGRESAQALAGGDDYELVFTAGAERRDAVVAAARAADTSVTRIGRVESGGRLRYVDAAGREVVGPATAFDHFLTASPAPAS